ncbi:hypothetical protein [Cellulomonas iranensis]|uniref:hypothetical protein n=1 Tax=Cellulomonas iranensis TaxID=76862 RepID=UPI0011774892|nr:hypothetical protein [Cellulomonas iranensis]
MTRRRAVRRIAVTLSGAAVLAVTLVLLAAQVASAAGLPLTGTGARAWAATAQRCQEAPVTVTAASGTAVRVTGVQAACVGRPLVVTLYDPAVTSSAAQSRRFTGQATAGATTTVAGGAFTPAAALVPRVTVDGWLVPSTWSGPQPFVRCTVPDDPAASCTATLVNRQQWGYPTPTTWLANVVVSSTSPTPVTWQVDVDLSDPELPFLARALTDGTGGLVRVAASACGDVPRVVTVRGTTAWGSFHQVQDGRTSAIQLRGDLTGSGGLLTCP